MTKKDIETLYFGRFRSLLADFPQGTIIPTEEPDFLVRGYESTIGVELTELHRETPAGIVPPQASEAMRHRVVARAQEIYAAKGLPPVYCTVFMNDDHIKRDEVETLAAAVADIVLRNFPAPNSSREESYKWTSRSYFPEIVKSVAVHRLDAITKNFFSCPGATWVPTLSSADINRALASKESKCSTYRTRCDEVWLLINMDIGSMSTWFEFDSTTLAVPFKTSFDRVFIMRHFGGELRELSLSL
jgi:hypothetical protein